MSERLAMPVSEFAAALGVTKNTVFNWIKKGQLQSVKIGGTRLIDIAEFRGRMNGTNQPKDDNNNIGNNDGYKGGYRQKRGHK